MDRKTFLKKTAGALLLATPAYVLISCSSSSDDNSPNNGGGGGVFEPDCLKNGATGSISVNHGHNLTVSATDVNSGAEKTYNITGSAGHSHSVTVTADDFLTLKDNLPVTIDSTAGGGHTHSVTVSCA